MSIFVLNDEGRIKLLAALKISAIPCNAVAFRAVSNLHSQAEEAVTAALKNLQPDEEASLAITFQASKLARKNLGLDLKGALQVQMRLSWFDEVPSTGNRFARSLQDILNNDDWTSELAEDVLNHLRLHPNGSSTVAEDCLRVLLQAENLILFSPDGTEGDHYSVRDLACMQCAVFLNG